MEPKLRLTSTNKSSDLTVKMIPNQRETVINERRTRKFSPAARALEFTRKEITIDFEIDQMFLNLCEGFLKTKKITL